MLHMKINTFLQYNMQRGKDGRQTKNINLVTKVMNITIIVLLVLSAIQLL